MRSAKKKRTQKSGLRNVLKVLGTIGRILWAVLAFALSVIVTLDKIALKLQIREYNVRKYRGY